MNNTFTIPEPAYKTHKDGADPAVRDRLAGVMETCGGGTLGQDEIRKCMKEEADNGNDPLKGGTIEFGLLLSESEYEDLKAYAKRLPINRPKIRRRT